MVSSRNTTALGKILFTLCSTDLDLLLFTAATEFIRLERALGLERRAAVLGDVFVGHFLQRLDLTDRVLSRTSLRWVGFVCKRE